MRIALTDKCNLRCFYCMPAEGIPFMPKAEMMTYEEILRLAKIVAEQGVSKIRLTGGEPFLRKDIMPFLEEMCAIAGIEEVHITTNGTLIHKHMAKLKSLKIRSINLSIDSVDRARFHEITRRDNLHLVMEAMDLILENEIALKLNMVVMQGKNIQDIIPMVELAKEKNLNVRFIEEMPFNGNSEQGNPSFYSHQDILNHIAHIYPQFSKLDSGPYSTSTNYKIEGFKGSFGIIAAFSRTFCGTCNRLRLTAQGTIKTCLYDDGIFNIKDLMRKGKNDAEILNALERAVGARSKDGFEAAAKRKNSSVSESMATIGG
ncbi:UNVERIFIED_CONTAM: hypothetical protein GTU68_062972 [Idotea baltica]|nr:hypothetical protein [Idotea baltica]